MAMPTGPSSVWSPLASGGSDFFGGAGDFFGPLSPPLPTAPPAVAGRRWDFQSGINLVQQPRAYEPISFQTLRNLADGYDILRVIIETRKDQMRGLKWVIKPRDPKAKLAGDLKIKAEVLRKFFRKPDRINAWDVWLGTVLEDLLVLDAPAIYKRPNMGGGLYALEPLDGSTIKRVVDDWGRTPVAPFPAYQQQLKGLPAVDYTVEELIYRPRNQRTHKLYGYSPVEQIVMTINIALKREIFQLEYFTQGNVPDSLIGVPETWTNTMIKEFQTWWDSTLLGNSAARRSARFVPGGVAKGYTPTKTDEIFGKAEEWLARVVCYAFSMSPQPFVQMMNRATGDVAKESATEEGLVPLKLWVKELIDGIIEDDLGVLDLEFAWLEEEEIDAKTKAEILREDVKAGIVKIAEARDDKGLDPVEDERANTLMVLTAKGYVPISIEDQMDEARQRAELAQEFMPEPVEGEGEDDPGGGAPPSGKGSAPAKKKPGASKPSAGGPGGGKGGDSTRAKAALSLPRTSKAAAGVEAPDLSPVAKRAITRLTKKFAGILATMGEEVAADVEAALRSSLKVTKIEPEDAAALGATVEEIAAMVDVDGILDDLDLSGFDVVKVSLQDELEVVLLEEGKRVVAALTAGTDIDAEDLFEIVNGKAVDYAGRRSAELVSEVTESTRNAIRQVVEGGLRDNIGTPVIADNLQSAFGFSADRAKLIAETEVRFANSRGALAGYKAARQAGVPLKKRWLLGADPCDVCIGNAAVGLIDLDENFPDGSEASPAHPRCQCAIAAEVVEAEAQ